MILCVVWFQILWNLWLIGDFGAELFCSMTFVEINRGSFRWYIYTTSRGKSGAEIWSSCFGEKFYSLAKLNECVSDLQPAGDVISEDLRIFHPRDTNRSCCKFSIPVFVSEFEGNLNSVLPRRSGIEFYEILSTRRVKFKIPSNYRERKTERRRSIIIFRFWWSFHNHVPLEPKVVHDSTWFLFFRN